MFLSNNKQYFPSFVIEKAFYKTALIWRHSQRFCLLDSDGQLIRRNVPELQQSRTHIYLWTSSTILITIIVVFQLLCRDFWWAHVAGEKKHAKIWEKSLETRLILLSLTFLTFMNGLNPYLILELFVILLWPWGFELFILKLSNRWSILENCVEEIIDICINENVDQTKRSNDLWNKKLWLLLEVPEFYKVALKVRY